MNKIYCVVFFLVPITCFSGEFIIHNSIKINGYIEDEDKNKWHCKEGICKFNNNENKVDIFACRSFSKVAGPILSFASNEEKWDKNINKEKLDSCNFDMNISKSEKIYKCIEINDVSQNRYYKINSESWFEWSIDSDGKGNWKNDLCKTPATYENMFDNRNQVGPKCNFKNDFFFRIYRSSKEDYGHELNYEAKLKISVGSRDRTSKYECEVINENEIK